MKHDNDNAVLPLIIILVIVGVVLLLAGWIVIALTMKSMLAILLVGAGIYLLVRPSALSGMGAQARVFVPLALIIIGVLFYAGVFDSIL